MRQAIVIGGSMAGMCAARALADHFDRVIVLDGDTYPGTVDHRVGVPQSHHAHALLVRGQRELERLFPGFENAMLAAGALRFDFTERMAVLRKWGWSPRLPCGLDAIWASRPLIESIVREQLKRFQNIESVERTTVEGLRFARVNRTRVTGVVARGADDERMQHDADLVVDASGRGSKAPKWFAEAGLPAPHEEQVDAFAGYASRFYKRPAPEDVPRSCWWDGLWIEWFPPDLPRGGVAFPIEGHRWLVTAAGFCKDYPPTDERGFLEFLRSFASPLLAEAVERCVPLSDIVANRSTTNRFRHYEKWRAKVDGFLAVGDSVCAFNPVYGQGMSTSAVCASILQKHVAELGPTSERLPEVHFAEQGRFLAGVWGLAAGADFAWPMTRGHRPLASKILQPYFECLIESAHCDNDVMRALVPIFHLLEDPNNAIAPSAMRAVLGSALRRRIRARSLRAPSFERGTLPLAEPEVART